MFKLLKSTAILIGAALLAPLVASQGVTAPQGFNITNFGLNGSGCPPGSAYYILSADRTAVTVSFSKYYAEAGPGVSISSNRRNCQLTFGIALPGGFSFGVATIDYRGFFQLDDRVAASQQAIYYFQGQIPQATARSTVTGPIPGKDYTYRDAFDLVSTVTSPCGATTVLNVNSDLRVNNNANPGGRGLITTDSVDGSFKQTFSFQWRRC